MSRFNKEKYISAGIEIIRDLIADIDMSKVRSILVLGKNDTRGSFFETLEKTHNIAYSTFEEMQDSARQDLQKYELIVSFYELHGIGDVKAFMNFINHALAAEGVFIGCLPGEVSLINTRFKLWEIEEATEGGYSNRIMPMIKLQDLNQILYSIGMNNVISFIDKIEIDQGCLYDHLKMIRECGESGAGHSLSYSARPMTRKLYHEIKNSSDIYSDSIDIIGFCCSKSTELFLNRIKK